jgi:hypothetical protein
MSFVNKFFSRQYEETKYAYTLSSLFMATDNLTKLSRVVKIKYFRLNNMQIMEKTKQLADKFATENKLFNNSLDEENEVAIDDTLEYYNNKFIREFEDGTNSTDLRADITDNIDNPHRHFINTQFGKINPDYMTADTMENMSFSRNKGIFAPNSRMRNNNRIPPQRKIARHYDSDNIDGLATSNDRSSLSVPVRKMNGKNKLYT